MEKTRPLKTSPSRGPMRHWQSCDACGCVADYAAS
jgi:hypothetical protein